jgi:hypothetical protein
MYRKSILSLTLLFFITISMSYGQAITSTARAEVLADLTIELEAGTAIDFGILPTNTPGEIRLDPNSFTNNVSVNPVTANVARFNILGQEDATINVTYDATVALGGQADPTNSITMTSIVIGDTQVANQETAAIIAPNGAVTLSNPDGEFYIWVGGTLPQFANQAADVYEGVFNISVAYN